MDWLGRGSSHPPPPPIRLVPARHPPTLTPSSAPFIGTRLPLESCKSQSFCLVCAPEHAGRAPVSWDGVGCLFMACNHPSTTRRRWRAARAALPLMSDSKSGWGLFDAACVCMYVCDLHCCICGTLRCVNRAWTVAAVSAPWESWQVRGL
jgi:hypothetical protein